MATDKQVLFRIENLENNLKNLENRLENLDERLRAEKQLEFIKHEINSAMYPNPMQNVDGISKPITPSSFVNSNVIPNQEHYDGIMPKLHKYIGGIFVQTPDDMTKFYFIKKDCHITFEESYPNSNRLMHKGEFSINIYPLVTADGEYKPCSLRLYRLTSGSNLTNVDWSNDHLEVQKAFRQIKDVIDYMFRGNPTNENVYEEYTNVFRWLFIIMHKNHETTVETKDEVFNGSGISRPLHSIKRVDVPIEIDVEVIEK